MKPARTLIVNADDFGISRGVNLGIIEAHARGIVTSASAMTRWPAARDAARLAGENPGLGIGLHVDLGEWVYRDDEWQPLYEVCASDDPRAVEREVRQQLADFRELFGRDPDHLDSHQHAHRQEPLRSILTNIARELNVPLRHFGAVQYCGDFYGQNETGQSFPDLIGLDALLRILSELPTGTSELCCHPASSPDLQTMYGIERVQELRTLCDSRVKQFIDSHNIALRSFANVSM